MGGERCRRRNCGGVGEGAGGSSKWDVGGSPKLEWLGVVAGRAASPVVGASEDATTTTSRDTQVFGKVSSASI